MRYMLEKTVSERQLNERLMNAVGSDEPITRTRSTSFFDI